ncbi:MAG TPA: nitroreductase family deazaflavin-dependent oxidoreductase [Dehalococcoidia bacterium]|nr:nitroreductase family deazaflavin-dependent oxidoreductase [Dehalococcoidia bacterium]
MDDKVREALSKGGVIDITTTGRRTGKPHRIEIAFHAFDGKLYISGMPRERKRDWLANMEANPRFTFHLKREVKADLPALARPITDAAERRAVLEKVRQAWGRGDIEEMVRWSPLVEVTIQE